MDEFNVKLDKYDGPFSVLLHLIEVHDIDLYDIEISLLTDQFLLYIENNAGTLHDLSEFLVLASKLLEIKSRMLLPNSSDFDDDVVLLEDDDPRLWLVETLAEYKKYRDLSTRLMPLYDENSGKYAREHSYYLVDRKKDLLKSGDIISPSVLSEVFSNILLKMPTTDKERAKYFDTLSFSKYSVEDVRENILGIIKEKKNVSFFEIIAIHEDVEFKITAFLAILELMKYEKVEAIQGEVNGDIRLIFEN